MYWFQIRMSQNIRPRSRYIPSRSRYIKGMKFCLKKIFTRSQLQHGRVNSFLLCIDPQHQCIDTLEAVSSVLKIISVGVDSKHKWVDSFTVCIDPYLLCIDTFWSEPFPFNLIDYVSIHSHDVSTHRLVFMKNHIFDL